MDKGTQPPQCDPLPTTGAGILGHADYGHPTPKWMRDLTCRTALAAEKTTMDDGEEGVHQPSQQSPSRSASAASCATALAAFEPLLRIVDEKMKKCPWCKVQHPLEILACCKDEADEVAEEVKRVAECHRQRLLHAEPCAAKPSDASPSEERAPAAPTPLLPPSAAAERHATEDLEEELGDVLFSALLLARTCERFYGKDKVCLEGALRRAADKVGHRCPYVFDERYATTDCDRASELWALVKAEQNRAKKEKRQREGDDEGAIR